MSCTGYIGKQQYSWILIIPWLKPNIFNVKWNSNLVCQIRVSNVAPLEKYSGILKPQWIKVDNFLKTRIWRRFLQHVLHSSLHCLHLVVTGGAEWWLLKTILNVGQVCCIGSIQGFPIPLNFPKLPLFTKACELLLWSTKQHKCGKQIHQQVSFSHS